MNALRNVVAAGLMLAVAGPAFAGNFSCGQRLIREAERAGPFKDEIRQQCGDPTYTEGNIWVYERGQRFTAILTFNSRGQLTSISRRTVTRR